MKRAQLALATGLLITSCLTAGCASRSEVEALAAEVQACEEQLAEKQAAVLTWEQRYDRESARWEEMEASVTEALPKALSEFHTEKDRILEMVPEQVEEDVSAYLEDYFATVMRGFELLKEDNEEIRLRLEATYESLQAVGLDTRAIGETIDRTVADERHKRQRVSQSLADVLEEVVQFDESRIRCKKCEEKLTLSRREREVILAFHGDLMSRLAALQSLSATSMPDRREAADGAAPETVDTESEEPAETR